MSFGKQEDQNAEKAPQAGRLEPGRKLPLPLGLLLGYPLFMAKSIMDIPKKKRGRPSTGGRREGVLVRLEPAQFKALDSWIAKQDAPLTRPEAIRAMIAAEIKTPHHFKLPEKTERHSQDEKTGRRA
jgi:hypothetical protein